MPTRKNKKALWQRAQKDFLEYLRLEKQCQAATITNYTLYLQRFLNFALSKKITHPQDINKKLIVAYRQWLKRQNLGTNTRNYHLVALRSWLKYLTRRSVPTLPADSVRLSRLPQRAIHYLSGGDLEKLLQTPLTLPQKKILRLRDQAMLELLYCAGLRVSELVRLRRQDISAQQEKFFLGSGGKKRAMFFSPSAQQAVRAYSAARHDSSPFLFIRHDRAGHPDINPQPLTARSVQRLVERYGQLAGIKQSVTPRILRHTFARSLLKRGGDWRVIQKSLGHKSPLTAQAYRL